MEKSHCCSIRKRSSLIKGTHKAGTSWLPQQCISERHPISGPVLFYPVLEKVTVTTGEVKRLASLEDSNSLWICAWTPSPTHPNPVSIRRKSPPAPCSMKGRDSCQSLPGSLLGATRVASLIPAASLASGRAELAEEPL